MTNRASERNFHVAHVCIFRRRAGAAPEGRNENSPALQCRICPRQKSRVAERRLKARATRQPSLRDEETSIQATPTLKRRAIFVPPGGGSCRRR
jgi:hypothetical protein